MRQRQLGLFDELIVDNFAGGGGASIGIEMALGCSVDIAVNHDAQALAMHEANHPLTKHFAEDVWHVDPVEVTDGKPVGLAWFSPDCTHFSRAKGGQPCEQKIRALPWVMLKWAKLVRPRLMILENVPEIQTWGPLLSDGKPCPARKGTFFKAFIHAFERIGYKVEFRELVAFEYGVPTTRKRLFMILRCDGLPIVWPKPTHGNPNLPTFNAKVLKKWRVAADCIDWSIPMKSIFDRKKPLADNTLRRIAKGIEKYVINDPQPFIVTCNHSGEGFRGQTLKEPFCTVTAARDAHALIVPSLIQSGWGEREGQEPRVLDLDKPLGVTPAQGIKHALSAALLVKNYGGYCKPEDTGVSMNEPLDTVTAQDHHWLVVANLIRQFGTSNGASLNEPAGTVMPEGAGKTGLVYSFLIQYNGASIGQSLRRPLNCSTSRDRFALISLLGQEWIFADILYRMLEPHELFAAQGFPSNYIIAPMYKGKPLTKTAQVRMCGNSVPPLMAKALVAANVSLRQRDLITHIS